MKTVLYFKVGGFVRHYLGIYGSATVTHVNWVKPPWGFKGNETTAGKLCDWNSWKPRGIAPTGQLLRTLWRRGRIYPKRHNDSQIHFLFYFSDAAVSTVKQELHYCGTEEGKLLEMRRLLVAGLVYPCLIFTESRQRAGELHREILLSADKTIMSSVLSGELSEAQVSTVILSYSYYLSSRFNQCFNNYRPIYLQVLNTINAGFRFSGRPRWRPFVRDKSTS